jgi:hypothetical protein
MQRAINVSMPVVRSTVLLDVGLRPYSLVEQVTLKHGSYLACAAKLPNALPPVPRFLSRFNFLGENVTNEQGNTQGSSGETAPTPTAEKVKSRCSLRAASLTSNLSNVSYFGLLSFDRASVERFETFPADSSDASLLLNSATSVGKM